MTGHPSGLWTLDLTNPRGGLYVWRVESGALSVFIAPCRSYWVGSVSWSAGGLLLACVLKRGSLLMVARLGGLLSLSTSGCNVDFSPAHFLPLHPLVTFKYESNVHVCMELSSSVYLSSNMVIVSFLPNVHDFHLIYVS